MTADLSMVLDGHLGGYIAGGDPGTWCPKLWSWIVKEFQIRSVLDVGCGEGHSTKFFRDLGCEVLGVDGCEQAIRDSIVPESVVRHDFCHGPFRPGRRFDLVWSCEFLEHIEEHYVPNVLGTLALSDKLVLVTHAFPGQKGHHHVNCQKSSYWISLLQSQGFTCPLGLTSRARNVTLGDYRGVNHFARSGLVFSRSSTVERQFRVDDVHRLGYQPSLGAICKGGLLRAQSKVSRAWKKLARRWS